ncbi:MAG: hypothetical protein J5943_01505 [Oribacterium sp.]|nr:hypothetical protein [Oribacterium sp.]MBP3296005.1 hypothetical protein [Lachnospiraceae bacterium]
MERLKFIDKRLYAVFAVLFLAGIVFTGIPVKRFMPHHLALFSYCAMIILWALSLNRRILNAKVRRRILIACVFMVLLFFLRMCKFSFFDGELRVLEHIWYSYYIAMTAIPMFVFFSAARIEPVRSERFNNRMEMVLLVLWLLLCIAVMTNSLHSQLFRITVLPDKEYTRGWLYFVVIIWQVIMGLGAISIMVRKCGLRSAKRLWYVPVLCVIAGFGLLIWYLVNGGAPKLFGYKLFHFQEAFCLPFITGFESAIVIGLIPANSAYRKVFWYSGLKACIYENGDKAALWSQDWIPEEQNEDFRLRKEEVCGGYIRWLEDISTISRLNHEIEEVTNELEDENDLICQENEVRSERVRIETRNRLYNNVASAVRTTAIQVNDLLEKKEPDSATEDLIYAAFLSACIKRTGNMMLLSDESGLIDSGELRLAISETMEYLKLKGSGGELQFKGERKLSSKFVLLVFELYENVLEDVWISVNFCDVNINCETGFDMLISTDAVAGAVTPAWKDKKRKEYGARLSVKYEDETFYIRMEADV